MLRFRLFALLFVCGWAGGAWAGALLTLEAPGATANANLGFRATSPLGDITGDGFPEVLLGAYRTTVANTSEAGAAYVFNGRTGAHVLTLVSPNTQSLGWFGHSVLGFADITSDGVPEIVVAGDAETPLGAPRISGNVYIFNGATQELLQTLVSPNPSVVGQFGIALASVPDTNDDGVPELAVSAFRETVEGAAEAGRVYVHDGATGTLLLTLNSPTVEFQGLFGVAVAGVPDLNGDGAGDLIIGASAETSNGNVAKQTAVVGDAGNVYVMDGATGGLLFTLTSPSPEVNGGFGFQSTAFPDITGDGLPDIAVGAFQETEAGVFRSGRVYLFDGTGGGLLSTFVSPRPVSSGLFGVWLSPLEDISGNGFPELLIGASNEDNGCANGAGRAYLYDAQSGNLLRELISPLPQSLGTFGFSLCTLPDANGDSKEDVVISALGETNNGVAGAGRAHIFYSPLLQAGDPGAAQAECRNNCPDDGPDADGDGLTACVEQCYGSSDNAADSDFDGMPDRFEADFGLDLELDDAQGDRDGDGLSNLQEFLGASSPVNARDPAEVFFVRTDGIDDAAGGTLEDPWRTLGFALDQVNGTPQRPVRIVVLCGAYAEHLILKPWTTLDGKPDADVEIQGAIRGADHAGLRNLTLSILGTDPFLLDAAGPAMTVSNVVFSGNGFSSVAGIEAAGAAAGSLVIDQCTFSDLEFGLKISGALPTVRRCIFERCFGAAIQVQDVKSVSRNTGKALGDATDPRTGWNTFRNNTGKNIDNQTEVAIPAELNDWNTESAEAIANSISGPADFEPFLPVGKALLASSLFCTVWEETTAEAILDAEVTLAPSSYPPVTENTGGVYAFPALLGSTYDLEVSAEGFLAKTGTVTLADGETLSMTVFLKDDGTSTRRCGRRPRDKNEPNPGDFALLALVAAGLLTLRGKIWGQ